jgi:protein-disulfide isomerase
MLSTPGEPGNPHWRRTQYTPRLYGLSLVIGIAWTGTLAAPPDQPVGGAGRQQSDPLIEQRTKGDTAAPITVYEVSDFQCPYCAVFSRSILPDLDREYIQTGKAQLIFVNLPLIDIHENSAAAHEFAMCAARQDRFWAVHDLLFRNQDSWSGAAEPVYEFMALADSAGLDRDVLMDCIGTGAVRWIVQAEAEAVARQGIRSTPSFIIDRGVISGPQPIDVWRRVLDSLYVVKTKGREETGRSGKGC